MKREISQIQWDNIFSRLHTNGKFDYVDDIVKWMNKHFEVRE